VIPKRTTDKPGNRIGGGGILLVVHGLCVECSIEWRAVHRVALLRSLSGAPMFNQ
jgi:hypothetical protein